MKKQEYKEHERKRRYYFFDYLFWLGEMAQWYYKGEPNRPDGESFLTLCFFIFIYCPVLCITGHFLGSPALELVVVAMIVVYLVTSHYFERWIYPFSRREAVMQHYEGRKFSPVRCYFFLFSLGFLLIPEIILITTALKWISEIVK